MPSERRAMATNAIGGAGGGNFFLGGGVPGKAPRGVVVNDLETITRGFAGSNSDRICFFFFEFRDIILRVAKLN